MLVDLLDEDYTEQMELVVHALNGICSVFELQSPTTKNDFCRMFIREGLLDPLSSALLNVMTSHGEIADEMNSKLIQIILVFCQVSQSDIHVRNALGTRKVVRRTCYSFRNLCRLLTAHIKPRTTSCVRITRSGVSRTHAQGRQTSVDESDAPRGLAERKRNRHTSQDLR